MSIWGEIDAEFVGLNGWAKKAIKDEMVGRDERAPTGSETGPSVLVHKGDVMVSGRLRDVTDVEDSPLVLAWFTRWACQGERATLTWELDHGPRYRYVYEDGELRKLKGVLDL